MYKIITYSHDSDSLFFMFMVPILFASSQQNKHLKVTSHLKPSSNSFFDKIKYYLRTCRIWTIQTKNKTTISLHQGKKNALVVHYD